MFSPPKKTAQLNLFWGTGPGNFKGFKVGVSKNRGVYPPKWMVEIMENPIKIHDLGGPPLFLETPRSKLS